MASILSDPENQNRSAEEVADLVIGALDDVRARTHRFAVVGQFLFPDQAPETPHTAILGPFSSRGILDTREKFLRALERPSAARNAGQDMRWDIKTGRGRGRFILAPAFRSARDAWNFFRPAEPEIPARFAHITESLARWEAGEWARQVAYGPVAEYERRAR